MSSARRNRQCGPCGTGGAAAGLARRRLVASRAVGAGGPGASVLYPGDLPDGYPEQEILPPGTKVKLPEELVGPHAEPAMLFAPMCFGEGESTQIGYWASRPGGHRPWRVVARDAFEVLSHEQGQSQTREHDYEAERRNHRVSKLAWQLGGEQDATPDPRRPGGP